MATYQGLDYYEIIPEGMRKLSADEYLGKWVYLWKPFYIRSHKNSKCKCWMIQLIPYTEAPHKYKEGEELLYIYECKDMIRQNTKSGDYILLEKVQKGNVMAYVIAKIKRT